MFSSSSREQFFSFPLSDKSFPLPSHCTDWCLDDSQWLGITRPPLDYLETVTCILAGRQPVEDISTFGLLTISASFLCRVCSVETAFTLDHQFLQGTFATQMDQPLEILHAIWKLHAGAPENAGSTANPLAQCAAALLNSTFYHLYGSQPLQHMKLLLLEPGSLGINANPFDLAGIQTWSTIGLNKALARAAEVFRHDCRTGIGYLQKVAPLKFSPMSANSICETG